MAPGLKLRVIDRDGGPWFVAKDLCDALGVDTSTGVSAWINGLDDDDKLTVYRKEYSFLPNRGSRIINESGLYSLILKSRKPEAKAFKKWVTSEVLPTIRKTGGYMVPSLITKTHQGLAFTFRADGWFNMTKAAAHFGKTLENFMRAPDTLEHIDALSNSVKNTGLKETNRGRYGGTWAHPKLAVFFARC